MRMERLQVVILGIYFDLEGELNGVRLANDNYLITFLIFLKKVRLSSFY